MEKGLALVIGGATGIGKAVSEKLIELGYTTVIGDISFNQQKEYNSDSILIHCDVSSYKSVKELFQTLEADFNRLDCMINCAGVGGEFSEVSSYSVEDWNKVIQVNLTGSFYCLKEAIRLMLLQKKGSIVTISSLLSEVGFANDSAYVASKHGIIGLTRSAALEVAEKGIRVNCVSPGFTETPMTNNYGAEKKKQLASRHALNRFAQPMEIANAALWLCSEEASFVTGHNLIVDGGYTIQ